METLKQTNIRGEVKETDKYSLKKQTNETLFVEWLKKQTNIRGDVKETDKYSWRR